VVYNNLWKTVVKKVYTTHLDTITQSSKSDERERLKTGTKNSFHDFCLSAYDMCHVPVCDVSHKPQNTNALVQTTAKFNKVLYRDTGYNLKPNTVIQ